MRSHRLAVRHSAALPRLRPREPQAPGVDRPRLEQLRQRVRERYTERVRQELDLTDAQMQRLRATVGTYGAERRDMEPKQRKCGRAGSPARAGRRRLARQRGPADGRADGAPRRYAESFRGEQAEMAKYLDPVQRAKITLLRERLLNRAREMRPRRPFMERRGRPE